MKKILFLLVINVSIKASQDIPSGMVDRNKLFDDIMGISEDEFKRLTHAPAETKPSTANAIKIIHQQIKKYPRAQTILHGHWQLSTLEELRACVSCTMPNKPLPTAFGSLHLIVHDPINPKKTHARALHEQFPDAYFQVSSNFNALEERMGNYRYNLSSMNDAPAHGEESVMATMGAAIYRRYATEPINLLANLSELFMLSMDENNTPIITGLKKSLPIRDTDMNQFAVGIHYNAMVTSGYNDDNNMIIRENDPFNRPKPAYNKWMSDMPSDAVMVNQIFTAAHNINPKTRPDIEINEEHKAIAHAIIRATYQATILTAIDNRAKDLILMMLRPEVFNNDLDWIIETLSEMTDIIIASGMRVHMVIRHRVPAVQEKFINDLQNIINKMESAKEYYKHHIPKLKKNIAAFFENSI